MLRFFRKIRQNLLADNKFTKYLMYAVGEILLVVIGILIALQINNWNEDRIHRKQEKEFIESVKNDLKQDRDFIELIIAQLEPRMEAYQTLNKDLVDLYENDRESLDTVFKAYFRSQRTFYPILGSYESAVAGNQLTNFRKKEVLQKIITLYNSTYDRLIDNGRILDERWAFVSKKYSYERRTGKFREMEPKQLTEFLDDVYHHYAQVEWYHQQLESALVEIDKINAEKT